MIHTKYNSVWVVCKLCKRGYWKKRYIKKLEKQIKTLKNKDKELKRNLQI